MDSGGEVLGDARFHVHIGLGLAGVFRQAGCEGFFACDISFC